MNFGMLTQAVYTPALTFLCKLARACVRVHKDLHSQTHTGHQAGPETHVLAQQNRDSHQTGWGCLLGKLEMESPRQEPSDDQGVHEAPPPVPWLCNPLQRRVTHIISFLPGTPELAKTWVSWRRSAPAPLDHQCSGLNSTHLFSYSLEVRSSKVKVSKGCVPFVGSSRESISLLFLAPRGAHSPRLVAPSSFKARSKASSNVSDSDLPVSLGTLEKWARSWVGSPWRWLEHG